MANLTFAQSFRIILRSAVMVPLLSYSVLAQEVESSPPDNTSSLAGLENAINALRENVGMPDSEQVLKDRAQNQNTVSEEENTSDSQGEMERIGWSGSIMFPIRDLRNLERVIAAYDKRMKYGKEDQERQVAVDSGDSFLDELITDIESDIQEKIPGAEKKDYPREAPAFYLSSIMFLGDDNWTIWLNGKKITSYQVKGMPDIQVMDVSDNSAELIWNTEFLDYISPHWRDEKEKIGQKESAIMMIDDKTGQVAVKLHPNQTFVTRVMQVVEGHASASYIGQNDAGISTSPVQGLSKNNDNRAVDLGQNAESPEKKMLGDVIKARRRINEREAADTLTDMYTGFMKPNKRFDD